MDSGISLVPVATITHVYKDMLRFLDDAFHLFQSVGQGVTIIRIPIECHGS